MKHGHAQCNGTHQCTPVQTVEAPSQVIYRERRDDHARHGCEIDMTKGPMPASPFSHHENNSTRENRNKRKNGVDLT